MSRDRVFLDANVLFSAANREDSALRRLWELEGVDLISSHYALEEARRNLLESGVARLQKLAEELHLRADPGPAAVPLPPDVELPENDRPILTAALDARATHLLSGDRKAFGNYFGRRIEGVLVLRPADYLRGRTP